MSRQSNQKVNSELFSLEPTALLEFFVIYYDYVNTSDEKLYIHGGTNGINGSIYWQGVEYVPFPIQSSGFESKGDGSLPRPKLAVSNQDFFVSNLIRRYNNLVGAKVVRKRTFLKFLDNQNFSEGRNPYGSADANAGLEDQVFFILRRSSENRELVEFELASPLEIENVTFPRRTVMARYCSFHYRGNGCRYMGAPIADENDRLVSLPIDPLRGLIRRYYDEVPAGNASSTANLTSKIAAAKFKTETIVSSLTTENQENIAHEYIGYIKIEEGQSGEYEFGFDVDDSADLFVNGELIAYHYGGGLMGLVPRGVSGKIALTAGLHRILIRHHDSTGPQGVTLHYKKPSTSQPAWEPFPVAQYCYDLLEYQTLSGSQRFYSDISLTRSLLIDKSTLTGSENRGKWMNKMNYRVGDYVYVENHNVKVSKRNSNASPNWEPLQKFYYCVKSHESTPTKNPAINREFWIADQCSKTLDGCRLRFGSAGYLPFGGFPGTEEYSISS